VTLTFAIVRIFGKTSLLFTHTHTHTLPQIQALVELWRVRTNKCSDSATVFDLCRWTYAWFTHGCLCH